MSDLTDKFTTISWNIDTNIGRIEDGYAKDTHPNWLISNRIPYITGSLSDLVEKYNPNVICIQECRKFYNKEGDLVDSITPMVNFFNSIGYTPLVCKYNSSNLAFSYITAYRNDMTLISTNKKYFTKSPEQETDHSLPIDQIKQHNLGELWERCTFINEFTNGIDNFVVFNVHLGLSLSARMAASDLLKTWAAEYANKKILIMGDFNAFPDWGGQEQIDSILQSSLSTNTELKLSSTNEEINSSFISFPYDFGKDEQRLALAPILAKMEPDERRAKIWDTFEHECSAKGGKLDWLFYSGFTSCNLLLHPTPTSELPSDYSEFTIKQYILKHKNKPAFASDHQPLIGLLKY